MIESTSAESNPQLSAIDRAILLGVDVNAMIENLRLTPTERLQRLQEKLNAIARGDISAEEPWSAEKQIVALEALTELRRRLS